MLRFILREINTESVFSGLKETSHIPAHRVIFARSLLSISAASKGFSTTMKRLVLSAKRRKFDFISRTLSLIYKKKNNGHKIDPWGTPTRMNTSSKFAPGKTTLCLLFETKLLNQTRTSPVTPAARNL